MVSEIKLILLISYLFVLVFYNLSALSKSVEGRNDYEEVFSEHFFCEAFGDGVDCSKEGFQQIQNHIVAFSVGHVLLSMWPFITFAILLDGTSIRRFCCSRHLTSYIS